MKKLLKLFIVATLIECISISTGVAYGASIDIVSAEDVSIKFKPLGFRSIAKITGISRDGSVILGRGNTQNANIYFLYLASSKTVINLSAIFEHYISSDGMTLYDQIGDGIRLSADGKVVVGTYFSKADHSSHVFEYSEAAGFKDIGNFGLNNSSVTVNGISSNGSLLVGSYSRSDFPGVWHAYKYSGDKGFVDLQGMGKDNAFANGVSSDGSIIVGNYRFGHDVDESFKLEPNGGIVDIARIGTYAAATLVSENGNVILGTYLGGFNVQTLKSYSRTFIYTKKGGVQELGAMTFLGDSSVPLSLSEEGDYFNGVYVDYFGVMHIFKATITE